MSWKKIIAAIVICGGLMAFLTYDARRSDQKQEAEEKASLVIEESFKWNDLASIKLVTQSTELEFEIDPQAAKGDKGPETWNWRIAKPFTTEAESNDVQNYLRTLRDIKSKSVVEENAADLKPFGLDDTDNKPLRIRLTLKDGSFKELLVGDQNPDKSQNYGRFADSRKVMLIEQRLNYLATKDFNFFRRKTLFDFDNQAVNRVVYRWQPEPQIEVLKETAEWRVHQPFKASGDDSRISAFLADIKNVRIDKYPSEKADADAAKYGLSKPRGTVEVFLKDRQEPLKLMVGAENAAKNGFYLRKSGSTTVYEMQNFHIDKLKKNLGSFVDHAVGKGIDVNRVNQLTVLSSNQERRHLKLLPTSFWQLEQGGKMHQASGEKIQVLLQKLADMSGHEYVARTPEKRHGLENPKLDLTIVQPDVLNAGKTKEFRLVFGEEVGKAVANAFVRGGPDNFVYAIDKSLLTMLQDSVAKLRDGYPVPAKPSYDSVRLQVGADAQRYVEVEDSDKGWIIKAQKGFSLPPATPAEAIIKALESLDTLRFLDSSQSASHQVDKERDLAFRFTYSPLPGATAETRPAERVVRLGFNPFGEGYLVNVEPGEPFAPYATVVSKFHAEALLKLLGLHVEPVKPSVTPTAKAPPQPTKR